MSAEAEQKYEVPEAHRLTDEHLGETLLIRHADWALSAPHQFRQVKVLSFAGGYVALEVFIPYTYLMDNDNRVKYIFPEHYEHEWDLVCDIEVLQVVDQPLPAPVTTGAPVARTI